MQKLPADAAADRLTDIADYHVACARKKLLPNISDGRMEASFIRPIDRPLDLRSYEFHCVVST